MSITVNEARARVKARVWQSLAQSDMGLKNLDREDLEALVDLVTDAALLEIDDELGKSFAPGAQSVQLSGDAEEVLWEGRPFMSISTYYVITNERVRIVEGLLGKDRTDIELVRIQDQDYTQSVGERMFNLGDITIHSHDRSAPKVVLRNVANPEQVHETLRRAVLAARKRHGLSYREEM